MAHEEKFQLIVTCEHASNKIPKEYWHLFTGDNDILNTHRAWDIGAAELARGLAKALNAHLFTGCYSRLLADLNRRDDSRNVFSRFTKTLDLPERQRILENYHAPYRTDVENQVRLEIESGRRVLHLSVHSFTPKLHGEVRNADVGFLYDPKHGMENQVARCLFHTFKHNLNRFRYRLNYPYLGIADSLTTYLRKILPEDKYAGIEFEVNQQLASGPSDEWKFFKKEFAETVKIALSAID